MPKTRKKVSETSKTSKVSSSMSMKRKSSAFASDDSASTSNSISNSDLSRVFKDGDFDSAFHRLQQDVEKGEGVSRSDLVIGLESVLDVVLRGENLDWKSICAIFDVLVPQEAVDGDLDALNRLLMATLKREKCQNVCKVVLKWTCFLVERGILDAKSPHVLYEPLLTTMTQKQTLRPPIAKLLNVLTQKQDAIPRRFKILKFLLKTKSTIGKADVTLLADKFLFLNPNLDSKAQIGVKRSPERNKPGEVDDDAMTESFERVWHARDPADNANNFIDDIVPEAKLTWKSSDLYPTAPNVKRRRKDDFLPKPEANPFETRSRMTLGQCKTVGDIYDNASKVELPPQTLALLANQGTFFLLRANRKPDETVAKFSYTLYHRLYKEFFGADGDIEKGKFLIRRIVKLQEFFLDGIPVVGRFLAHFLDSWDGEKCLNEILFLLDHLQITDFDEFNDCILQPLTVHFTASFDYNKRLLTLVHLHRLLFHWIHLEYGRAKRDAKRVFGTANAHCRNPLHSVAELLRKWSELAELGLVMAMKTTKWRGKRMNLTFYVQEIISMTISVSRLMIRLEMPLCAMLSPGFFHYAMFYPSPFLLSQVLEYLTMTKHEVRPLCSRLYEERREEEGTEDEVEDSVYGGEAAAELAEINKRKESYVIQQQLPLPTNLSGVIKDIFAVLFPSSMFVDPETSIFRYHWEIEQEQICDTLKYTSNLAFLPLVNNFVEEFATKHDITKEDVRKEMQEDGSLAAKEYHSFIGEKLPHVMAFIDSFQKKPMPPKKAPSSVALTSTSDVTSGISSMQPSRRTRKR